jgi:hypothetical protein
MTRRGLAVLPGSNQRLQLPALRRRTTSLMRDGDWCSWGLAGPLLGCLPDQPLLVFFQWGPDPKTGSGRQGALAGVAVKGEEPCATHGYRPRNQHEVVATWAQSR